VLNNLPRIVEFKEVRRKVISNDLKQQPLSDTELPDDQYGTDDETDTQGFEKLKKKPSIERGASEPILSSPFTSTAPIPVCREDSFVQQPCLTRLEIMESCRIEESTEEVCLLPTPEPTPETERKEIVQNAFSQSLTTSEESQKSLELPAKSVGDKTAHVPPIHNIRTWN